MTQDTPPASVQDPLSPDDFDAQDAVLDQLREADEDVPDWEYCEGFLAALVCSRREIPPEEYWPVLLGEGFKPMEQMEFVWRWKRRWQEIATGLDTEVDTLEDERAYQPEILDVRGAVLALPEAERGDTPLDELPSFAEAWAHGFMHAVQAFEEDWAPPRDKEVAEMLADAIQSIEQLASSDTDAPVINMHTEDGPPSVSDMRLNEFGEAIWSVYDIRQIWRSLGPRIEAVRKAPEPGRNDPCSCGSGKKYKKCCGA